MPEPDNREILEAQLRWQVEMGATERISEQPIDRLAQPIQESLPSTPENSYAIAQNCQNLQDLVQALDAFPSPLKEDTDHTVLSDGNPNARVMIIGEAPGAEEDRIGRPFTGKAGQLLDAALARIGLDRSSEDPNRSVYITNIAYWRPHNNRTPTPEECKPLIPFCERHIALVKPDFLLLLGNIATKSLLRTEIGITRLRGSWKTWTQDDFSIPAMPTFHTAYLLRNPANKALFWQDLLSLQQELQK